MNGFELWSRRLKVERRGDSIALKPLRRPVTLRSAASVPATDTATLTSGIASRPNLVMDLSSGDLLRSLARQSAYIQKQLQLLLDAQSDGLIKGLGRQSPQRTSATPASTELRQSGHFQQTSPASTIRLQTDRNSVYKDDPLDSSPPPHSPPRLRLPQRSQHLTPVGPIPVRQPPPPKPPTLKEARLGIAANLRTLAEIKSQEADIYQNEAAASQDALDHISSLAERRDGLYSKINELETGPSDRAKVAEEQERDTQLRHEQEGLEQEIGRLEDHLSDLKAKLRVVKEEKLERENNRAATLSSWKNALAELDKTIKNDVLGDRGRYARSSSGLRSASGSKARAKAGVWALPADRRTLELVQEDFQSEEQVAKEKQQSATLEANVCGEGAQIWEAIVSRLSALEKRLAKEIRKLNGSRPESRLSQASSSLATRNPSGGADADAVTASSPSVDHQPDDLDEGMRGVLNAMERTAHDLMEELAACEEKGWTLLSCCIAAEVEALREAHELLGDTLVRSQVLTPVEATSRPTSQAHVPHSSFDATSADVGPIRSEGSTPGASTYTARTGPSAAQSTVLRQDSGQISLPESEDIDPQALFGEHEDEEHQHHQQDALEGPELLVAHE